jgi:putative methionine-R-sulfoxide reductase with GAF domain
MRDRTGPYAEIAREAERLAPAWRDREAAMAGLTDLLWTGLSALDVAWLGFYTVSPEGDSMVLSVCRPKPACSPIGLHGVCGSAFVEGRCQIVGDVHALGDRHIVCDPGNRSEIVVPCFEAEGRCWGVLDLDSRELDSFGAGDAEGLERVLRAAGLTGDPSHLRYGMDQVTR